VSKRRRSKRETDPLAVYRRIRKPMPPPERIVPDKRRDLEQDEARREIEEGVGGAHGASADARAAAPREEGVGGARGASADARAVAPREEER
jgi:hypothetical protein